MSKIHSHKVYPFSAIVGQGDMKKALILNAINPAIGGVLIKGERGTAKSTAVRSLAALLPKHDVVMGCIFGCDPHKPESMCENCRNNLDSLQIASTQMNVVELPISATEDMVVGSLDISAAIKKGDKKFEPGILASAHRNILYVDEVNLLNDHIVDLLLDVAAMGINVIEREGISYMHPSSFLLIGTMNPEEGDLRPQLLDRFGLCVLIQGITDADERLEVILRRMEFESDSSKFIQKWSVNEKTISDKIIHAKEILPHVTISEDLLKTIVQICIDAGVDGHRGDITLLKTSKTLAAYCGRTYVTEEDISEAAKLVLIHRMKKTPFSNETYNEENTKESMKKARENSNKNSSDKPESNHSDACGNTEQKDSDSNSGSDTKKFKTSDPFASNPQH